VKFGSENLELRDPNLNLIELKYWTMNLRQIKIEDPVAILDEPTRCGSALAEPDFAHIADQLKLELKYSGVAPSIIYDNNKLLDKANHYVIGKVRAVYTAVCILQPTSRISL